MNKILIVLLCVSMTSCGYQVINQHDLKMAEFSCKDKEGVFEIKEYWNSGTYVICKDGNIVNLDAVKID